MQYQKISILFVLHDKRATSAPWRHKCTVALQAFHLRYAAVKTLPKPTLRQKLYQNPTLVKNSYKVCEYIRVLVKLLPERSVGEKLKVKIFNRIHKMTDLRSDDLSFRNRVKNAKLTCTLNEDGSALFELDGLYPSCLISVDDIADHKAHGIDYSGTLWNSKGYPQHGLSMSLQFPRSLTLL